MIKRNGLIFHTPNELDDIMYEYIKQTAKELKLEFIKKESKLDTKKVEYV
ncbi:MAG: hypothetical protein PHE25_05025 [Candidatus Gracilibacteria bacterium]|nr:hypothetical protein [Candidatus Gracilibacteria bacterium]